MKILLANDTGIIDHFGCLAVSDAHARMLGRAGHTVASRIFVNELKRFSASTENDLIANIARDDALVEKIEACDAVVVNGEGTIHHGAGQGLLALLAVAQSKKKITVLVNAVLQETNGFDTVFAKLEDITVREPNSLYHLKSRGYYGRVVPDSAFGARYSEAAVGISGIAVTDCHPSRTDIRHILDTYVAQNESATRLPLQHAEIRNSWSALPSSIRNVDLLITGRHHGVYLALLAGIPFVALPSNTFKIEGALKFFQFEKFFAQSLVELSCTAELALDNRSLFKEFSERQAENFPLTTFDILGTTGENREFAEVANLQQQISEFRGTLSPA